MNKLKCIFGLHGPYWTNNSYFTGPYSERTGPFERTCPFCNTVWHGGEVIRNNVRTLGDWVIARTNAKDGQ